MTHIRATNIRVMALSVSLALARSQPEEGEFPSASSPPGITKKPKNPSLKWRAERISPLHVLQDPVQITGDHQGDSTFQHAAQREEWTGYNNARGPFDELSCSSRYKNSSLSVPRNGPEFSQKTFHLKTKNKPNNDPNYRVITPYLSFF